MKTSGQDDSPINELAMNRDMFGRASETRRGENPFLIFEMLSDFVYEMVNQRRQLVRWSLRQDFCNKAIRIAKQHAVLIVDQGIATRVVGMPFEAHKTR